MSGPQTRLELRQSQRTTFSTSLQQCLVILTLGGSTLEEMIAEAAADNPFLVYTPIDRMPAASSLTMSPYDVALQTVASRPSLAEHLCAQLALMDIPAQVADSAMRLAYDLDDSGFFSQPDVKAVASDHGLRETIALQAIKALQACEPAGVGAFNLLESLHLQLAETGLSPERIRLVLAGVSFFSRGQTNLIGPALGLSRVEADEITALVRSLDPAPGRAFDTTETQIRVPELVVTESSSGALMIELVNEHASRLRLDTQLVAARGNMGSPHLTEAKALISALQFRGKTLLEVGEAIVNAQAAYFSGLSSALAPLTRSAVAAQLGLHKSTVGRAIAGKTLLWNGRIVELESLFPSALGSRVGHTVSSHAAQLAIARLVANEVADAVLSDDEISTRLREDGVDISRRTVAKYRKCLNIPSSSKRRRLLNRAAE